MKKNNLGFMLAEVIIVSVVLMVTMVGMYAGLNKLYTNYRIRHQYYNIDALLSLGTIKSFLIDEMDLNIFINELDADDDKVIDIINYYNNNDLGSKGNYFSDIVDFYQISKLYIYDGSSEIYMTTDDPSFSAYLQYIKEDIDQTQNRYLILEITKTNQKYYAYLAIGGNDSV